jgi:phosphoglycerate dehydrogenase-like enzyme
LTPEEEARYGAVYAPLEDIMKTADVVSVHLPLTARTQGIVSAPSWG